MKSLILLILFLFTLSVQAENRTKIAVVDTGVFKHMVNMPFMCKDKPLNFIEKYDPYDRHGHGSNIIGIIGESLNPKTHCIISLKFYHKGKESGVAHLQASIKAFKYILSDKKIKYLNISMGGPISSQKERQLVKKMLDRGITIVASAGNEESNLDNKNDKYYPASYRDDFKKYDNFFVVASRHSSSNYGSIVTDVFSGIKVGPKNIPLVEKMTGTSQAAAQKMSKILKNVVLLYRSKLNGPKTSN